MPPKYTQTIAARAKTKPGVPLPKLSIGNLVGANADAPRDSIYCVLPAASFLMCPDM